MSWVERPNWVWRLTTVRETLKKSRASHVQASQLGRDQEERAGGGWKAYPEKKRPHWERERVARTSSKGLVRSVFSLFGTRFWMK